VKIVFVHLGREHLGIEFISSVLKNAGHKVFLAHDTGLFSREDNVFSQPLLEKLFSRRKNIIKKIQTIEPDLIAFSVYSSTYPWARSLAEEIKKKFGLPILFGGIHPTLVPEEVIRHDFVDYLIRGEGEYAMLELTQCLEGNETLSRVKNLWYKKGCSVIKNDMRPPLRDLDSLPFPDKELFEEDVRYKDDYMIMAGRGCLYECSYCCESYMNAVYNHKYYRRRGVDSVITELKKAKEKYKIKEVMFFDSIFFSEGKWLKEFLIKYQDEIGVPFRCTGHVNLLNEEIARVMKNAGCYGINFGVQTFNENIRKNFLNRVERNAQIEKAFKICDDFKMRYDVDLILGLPGATEDDYKLPFKFFRKAKFLNRVKCYYLTYYPKLAISKKSRDLNLLNEQNMTDIEMGEAGDWFHRDFFRSKTQKRLNASYSKIYKIYPLLPDFLKDLMLRTKLVRFFYLMPRCMIVVLQLIRGIAVQDYRFLIYIKHYLHIISRKIIG